MSAETIKYRPNVPIVELPQVTHDLPGIGLPRLDFIQDRSDVPVTGGKVWTSADESALTSGLQDAATAAINPTIKRLLAAGAEDVLSDNWMVGRVPKETVVELRKPLQNPSSREALGAIYAAAAQIPGERPLGSLLQTGARVLYQRSLQNVKR